MHLRSRHPRTGFPSPALSGSAGCPNRQAATSPDYKPELLPKPQFCLLQPKDLVTPLHSFIGKLLATFCPQSIRSLQSAFYQIPENVARLRLHFYKSPNKMATFQTFVMLAKSKAAGTISPADSRITRNQRLGKPLHYFLTR